MSSIWTDHDSAAEDPLDPTRGLGPEPAGDAAPPTARRAWGGTAVAPPDDEPTPDAPGVPDGLGHDVGGGSGQDPSGEGDPGDGSHGDPTGAVHVRLAEGGLRVVGVRISNRWRERLRRTDLATALRTACHRAQVAVPRPRPEPAPAAPGDRDGAPAGRRPPGSRSIDWAGFNALLETTRVLSEEARARRSGPAEDRRAPELTTPPARGEAAGGRVRVVLAPTGQVAAVEIDQRWADQSRVTELTSALEQALTAAYDVWQPPEYELGEAGRLMARMTGHREQLMDLIAGRR